MDRSPNSSRAKGIRSLRKDIATENAATVRTVGQTVTIGGDAPLHWHGEQATVIHVKPKTVDVAFPKPLRNGWGTASVRVKTFGRGDVY